jgi:hypothetical protein
MAKEEIPYKEWRIDVMPHGGGWKAFIYRPGATRSEEITPHAPYRITVIEAAQKYIDEDLLK